jgi:predicted exporter
VHHEVSVIVIGISSIIVGIAVNYPLHLIAHLDHVSDVRQALKEIVKPLTVGNITTVGAFLTLVPLRATALRDLGLFSSFLLIGTILFTLVWLPQMLRCGVRSVECVSRREECGVWSENTPAAGSACQQINCKP